MGDGRQWDEETRVSDMRRTQSVATVRWWRLSRKCMCAVPESIRLSMAVYGLGGAPSNDTAPQRHCCAALSASPVDAL